MIKKTKLPYGVQDYLPEECHNKKKVEDAIAAVFSAYGYDRVETPALEYFSTFSDILESESINKMFKMTDNDGSLLVLRPDNTLQICRMAAKMEIENCKKLFYIANSFEYLPDINTARTREFSQAGVELLGKLGIFGDIEIISLALDSFKACELSDYLIELGHMEFFKGLMEEFRIPDEIAAKIAAFINSKDMMGLAMFLQENEISGAEKETLMQIPSLFGGVEILKKAAGYVKNERSLKALSDLENIVDSLSKAGNSDNISLDLGLLHGYNYYSGIIFRGFVKDMGLSILDGGRYDKIGGAFCSGMEAVGFAIGIKRILVALEKQNRLEELKGCAYAYISDNKDPALEHREVSALRYKGFRVTKMFEMDKKELIKYCRENRIPWAFRIVDGKMENLDVK